MRWRRLERTIDVDLDFFTGLQRRFGARGHDFAEGHVIAHEAGHHVQKLPGISDEVESRRRSGPASANEWSVALELQAGRIRTSTQRRIDPESWTHGSSAQRVEWFTIGYRTGDPNACDTFG